MSEKNNIIKAINKNVRSGARKANLVLNFIKGKKADLAIRDLDFTRKKVAEDIKKTIKCFTNEIKRIEEELKELILSDNQLNSTIGLVTSVTGIGTITALYFTIFTNFFTRYTNPKQLACYCGVVPFEHTSGSSVHKQSKTHPIANQTLKKQLHMCALAAVRHDPDLKVYYHRKAEEGKNKMLVLNNVRNKLVLRICAVVKRQKPYKKQVA